MLEKIEYLGHYISAKGIHPTDKKVKALQAAPVPENISQLKSFLGFVNYYCKIVPHSSSTLSPLYRLLQKHARWHGGRNSNRHSKKLGISEHQDACRKGEEKKSAVAEHAWKLFNGM